MEELQTKQIQGHSWRIFQAIQSDRQWSSKPMEEMFLLVVTTWGRSWSFYISEQFSLCKIGRFIFFLKRGQLLCLCFFVARNKCCRAEWQPRGRSRITFDINWVQLAFGDLKMRDLKIGNVAFSMVTDSQIRVLQIFSTDFLQLSKFNADLEVGPVVQFVG